MEPWRSPAQRSSLTGRRSGVARRVQFSGKPVAALTWRNYLFAVLVLLGYTSFNQHRVLLHPTNLMEDGGGELVATNRNLDMPPVGELHLHSGPGTQFKDVVKPWGPKLPGRHWVWPEPRPLIAPMVDSFTRLNPWCNMMVPLQLTQIHDH